MPAKAMNLLQDFLKKESAGGIILMISALLALIIANSPLSSAYTAILATQVTATVGGFGIDKPLLLWINDGLMAVFFFLIGLEVKREVLTGQLASWEKSSLPVFAAIGGMAIPALIYIGINSSSPENINGWAIPAATDIAFALGILALLGNRVPFALKALLLAIAIIDDIGAIMIIAFFYTAEIQLIPLAVGLVALVGLILCNRFAVVRTLPYVLLTSILWLCILKSGVHATLAGVAAALTIPIAAGGERPLERMEHALHPWAAFFVIPVFALANAGVSFSGMSFGDLLNPVPLGIAMGLVLGKQIGILGFAWVAVKAGFASLPTGVSWLQISGLASIAGVGFTMSLFIGNLAFDSPEQMALVKIGVLSGSTIAALVGIAILKMASPESGPEAEVEPAPESGQQALPSAG